MVGRLIINPKMIVGHRIKTFREIVREVFRCLGKTKQLRMKEPDYHTGK